MTKKVLKKYTTIPQHLYVERTADRQLRDIIEDMERPGYVLVARQMGKTNLLFNAKRNLESDSRKFVYIDLSNKFDTERECYNYIIDSILNVLEEELWEIRPEVENIREKTVTDHISYTKSLSKILKSLEKDLIIILDEIDALRSSEYSDNIFAVIRSNYFTRSNFAEFERLTYILSGVIEPKDLIKDRNKSPFNIGEKIYLEDFSYTEFRQFINKSKLNIGEELEDYIYSWTSGNPRLTFDICSEVETLIIDNKQSTSACIEKIIIDKYLTSFDIAPIDHIRELVSENKSVREAIHQIISGDNELINMSDTIKNKLYLYGIISSGKNDNLPKIKNKIIEASLSIKWLRSLEEDPQVIIDNAIKLVDIAHDYHKAIELLTNVILMENIEQFQLSIALYYLGFAERNINEFESSNTHLLQQPFTKNSVPVFHFRQKLFTGLNFIQLGDIQKGKDELRYVVDNYKDNLTWANAALSLALSDIEETESASLLHEIVLMNEDLGIQSETESVLESKKIIKTIKSYAYYKLSDMKPNVVNQSPSEYLNLALKVGVPEHIPSILLKASNLENESNTETLEKIARHVLSVQLSFPKHNSTKLDIDYNESLHYYVMAHCYSNSSVLFEELFKYSTQNLNLAKDLIILNTLKFIPNESLRYAFLDTYADKERCNNSLEILRIFASSAIMSKRTNNIIIKAYFSKLIQSKTIQEDDILTISLIMRDSIENNTPKNGIYYSNKIEHLFQTLEGSLIYESSIFYYWKLQCSLELGYVDRVAGAEVLSRLKSPFSGKSIIDEEGARIIRKYVSETLNQSKPATQFPIRRKNLYKRNEKIKVKYENGRIVEDKYKKLQSDIDKSICEIIN